MVNRIRKLIEQGESLKLDFKFSINDSRKIARSMTAFANTEGGILLIGVKDNGSLAGVRSEEEIFMIESAAELYSKPRVIYNSTTWTIEGKTIVEVNVLKSETPPHFVLEQHDKLLAYIRVNDQNLLANGVMIKVWEKRTRHEATFIRFGRNEKFLLTYLEEYKTITLPAFCRSAQIKTSEAERILVDFIQLNIINIVFTEEQIYYRLNEDFDKATVEHLM